MEFKNSKRIKDLPKGNISASKSLFSDIYGVILGFPNGGTTVIEAFLKNKKFSYSYSYPYYQLKESVYYKAKNIYWSYC